MIALSRVQSSVWEGFIHELLLRLPDNALASTLNFCFLEEVVKNWKKRYMILRSDGYLQSSTPSLALYFINPPRPQFRSDLLYTR